MAILDLANTPIIFNIGDKELKVQRLSIKEIFGTAEASIRSKRMAMAMEIANSLIGKEKMDFLMQCQNKMPKGDELNQESQEWLNSPDGISTLLKIGLNKFQKVSEEEITQMILGDYMTQVQAIIKFLIGIDISNEVKEIDVEKKNQVISQP